MSERTFKAEGWMPQGKPKEGRELTESRQLIREVIFSLHRQKTQILAKMSMPPQPVNLNQIYLEICSRIAIKHSCHSWPYPHHEKRWWDRRVNESACGTYAVDGVPKIIAASAGLYEPNKALFERKPLEASQ